MRSLDRETPEKDTRTDDDEVTLALTREEVAALVLRKCKAADFYDWLAEDPQDGDTHDLLRLRSQCLGMVDELDGHLTDRLRLWVKKRLGDERRKHHTKNIREFLEHMSNDAVRALYDSMVKIESGRVESDDTQRLEEERQKPAQEDDQEDGPITPAEADANDDDQFLKELREMEAQHHEEE